MSIELVYFAFQLKIHAKTTNLKTNHTQWNTLCLLHPKRINGGNSGNFFSFLPPHRLLFVHPRVKSYVNNWLQMHSLDFVPKNENKTKFNQRDQYKNYSTFLSSHGMLLAQFAQRRVLILPDKFREMTKQSNPALRIPVVILSDTLFWLQTVSFVLKESLEIFSKFNPPTDTHPCGQLWNALFVNFSLWRIGLLLWKKDGIFAITPIWQKKF